MAFFLSRGERLSSLAALSSRTWHRVGRSHTTRAEGTRSWVGRSSHVSGATCHRDVRELLWRASLMTSGVRFDE